MKDEGNHGPLLEVERLDVCFGDHGVLRDISFQVTRGQTVVIVGESGCGKTVLLKTLIWLIRPTSGTVRFDGQDLRGLNDVELTRLRSRFGFVFQQAALFDSLTVRENVAFPLRQHRQLTEMEMDQIVRRNLADVGLPDSVLKKKPAELSGGMRKRVGLARALATDPELLLYDEPTTGLDPIMSDVINQLVLRTQRRGNVTSVVITHDMQTVRKVADRVIMIYPLARLKPAESQILFDGTVNQLEQSDDPRVQQFVRGEAGERLKDEG